MVGVDDTIRVWIRSRCDYSALRAIEIMGGKGKTELKKRLGGAGAAADVQDWGDIPAHGELVLDPRRMSLGQTKLR